LPRLDQLESAFIADVTLLAAVADGASDQVFEKLKITDGSKRDVRRAIWSALLPLKTSLAGIVLHEDRQSFKEAVYKPPFKAPNMGATLKTARQKFQACAANITLDSPICKDYQKGEFYGLFPDRTRFIFYSQSVPIYAAQDGRYVPCKVGSYCEIESANQLFGWVLLFKPWRFPVTDKDDNGNDRSNFGEASIAREKTLATGKVSAEQISLNNYIADLFDSPTDFYQVFVNAKEAWGAGVYENTTYRKNNASPDAKVNSPGNLIETSLFSREYVGRSGHLIGKFDSVGSEFAMVTRMLDLNQGPLPAQSTDPTNFTAYAKYYDADFSWLPKDFGGGHPWEFKQATTLVHPLPHRIFWRKDGNWIERVDELTQLLARVDEP